MASAVTTGPAAELGSAATLVIQQKLEVPPLSETRVARPRVESRLAELIDSHRVVAVLATAGAGKTTAVAAASELLGRPIAWLTLDTPDAAQGRLLTYLEASLARVAPQVRGVVAQALSAGLGHVEAAGLLADALGDARIVLVLDDMERLGEAREPWELIDSLLRHVHSSLRAVLISRRDVPRGLSALRPSTGAMAAIGDADLTFTAGEAAQALAEVGKGEADAASVVEATGGWVTGVLFEAWRSAEHVPGMGGEADPLHGYLSAQMLAELCPEDRDFLIETAVLHDVSPARAAALGRADAGERLASLRAAHLPVAWARDELTMRCHRRFHEYLMALLERLPPERIQALRLAHGRLLADEGLHEEATEELLRAGAPEEAFRSARRAIFAVIERVDYPTAERWIATLEPVVPAGAHDWVEAELLLGFTKLEYARSEQISDRLLERGEREAVAASSERAAALMAVELPRRRPHRGQQGGARGGARRPGARRGALPRVADLQRRARGEAGRPAAHGRPVRLGDPDRRLPARAPAGPARVRRLGLGARRRDAVADRDAAGARPDAARDRALRGGEGVAVGAALPDAGDLHRPGAAGRRRPPRRGARRGRRGPPPGAGGRVAEPARAELVRGGEAGAAAREGPGAGARRARPRRERPQRPPDRLGGGDVRHALRAGAAAPGPRRARARPAALGGGEHAGGRPDPRAADRGGLPGRGRVARRQRGRRRPRRRHRARGRPAPGLQPHPHAGARRPARRALAPHRRRAERGLDLAPARPRADRPGRAPDREPGRVDPLQRLRRALARGRRRAAPAEDLQELRAARLPADARRGHARGAARRALRAAAPTTPRARTCARRSTGCARACRSGRSSRRRAAPSRSPTTC